MKNWACKKMVITSLRKILICNIILWNILVAIEGVKPVGRKLLLNNKEESFNTHIKQLKYKALEEIKAEDSKNLDFYGYKEKIEESKLFRIIRKMPKGASLDGNFFGLISQEYLYNLTFLPGLFVRIMKNSIRFTYKASNSTSWSHLRTLRKNGKISEDFIKEHLSFQKSDFKNITVYARKITNTLTTVKSLLSKVSVLKAALYHVLQEYYDDNVTYVEFRYSLDFFDTKLRKSYRPVQVLKICNKIIDKFRHSHQGFFGAKIIYSPVHQQNFEENLGNLMEMIQFYPKVLVGFDLKADEIDFGKVILELRKITVPIQLFLYFGRDVTFKKGTNLNLINSMVNRPSRYSYFNNLLKNKAFYEHIKGLGVGIGISPLSLVRVDLLKLRSSPYIRYITDGYRILISNEYPSFLHASGISYDWYLLFVFMTEVDADLSFLKYMALNSLIYSGLPELEAMEAISLWTELWHRFIEEMQNYDNLNF